MGTRRRQRLQDYSHVIANHFIATTSSANTHDDDVFVVVQFGSRRHVANQVLNNGLNRQVAAVTFSRET